MHGVARRRRCVGHISYVLTSKGIRDLWEVANQPQLTIGERDSLRLVLAEIESSRAEEARGRHLTRGSRPRLEVVR